MPPWAMMLIGILTDTVGAIVKGIAQGKSESELAAIATESTAAQAVLLAEQRRVLEEAEHLVPGFQVKP